MLLAALLVVACDQAASTPTTAASLPPLPSGGEVVATVNGTPIHRAAVDAALEMIPEAQRKQLVAAGRTDALVEDLVNKEVLVQEALRRGLLDDPDTKAMMAFAERQALIANLFRKVGAEAATDEAIAKWYEDHKVQFHKPQVHAAHILVDDEALARRLADQARAPGADFAALAREHSKDKGSAARGGDLGWFEKGRMVAPFAEAAFSAEPGTIVGPVQTRFGWHVIQVIAKRDLVPLEEVRDEIRSRVENEAMQAFSDELMAKADISMAGGGKEAPGSQGQ